MSHSSCVRRLGVAAIIAAAISSSRAARADSIGVLDPSSPRDIGAGQLLLDAGSFSDDALRDVLAAAYDGGKWDGAAGLTSTYAADNPAYAIGYGTATDGATGAPAGQLLVKTVLVGDTTLKGSVGFGDVQNLLAHFGQRTGATWADGDFNYDGAVGFSDYQALLANFGRTSTIPAGAQPAAAAVPLPRTASAALMLLACLGAAHLIRRTPPRVAGALARRP